MTDLDRAMAETRRDILARISDHTLRKLETSIDGEQVYLTGVPGSGVLVDVYSGPYGDGEQLAHIRLTPAEALQLAEMLTLAAT